MKKMKKYAKVFLFLLLLFLVLAGCSKGSSTTEGDSDTNKGNEEDGNKPQFEYSFDSTISGDVTFWIFGTEQVYRDIITEFNKVYPDVNVKLVPLNGADLHNNLQTTLATGSGAPDVAQVNQGNFPRYIMDDLLVDLLQPPYNAGKYKELVSEYSWERWKSIDGEQLLGMPWDVTVGVFYYRQDLYDEMGLPSDPEDLGEYLQDPNNHLEAAKTFAANDIYMLQWRDTPAVHYGDTLGYFDSEFNYLRNDEKMADLLDFVKQGIQIGWAPQMNVLGTDEGKQLVNQGKVASFPLGSFGARELKNVFPDQARKWRATKMPLCINVGLGGSTFVIPSQSNNKDAAWALVEWMMTAEEAWKVFSVNSVQSAWKHIAEMPWYQERENEFLGGQQDFKLYDSIDDNIPVRRFTPLDNQAWQIYIDGLNESINNNIDSKTILNQIESDTLKQLGTEIEELKAKMNN